MLIYCVIGDIRLPQRVQDAMQMQVEAERKKRAAILESEGVREAEVMKQIGFVTITFF